MIKSRTSAIEVPALHKVSGFSLSETPPRTWGRLVNERLSPGRMGNTPTHVGKTTLAHLEQITQ